MLYAREFTKDDEHQINDLVNEINTTDQNFEGLRIINYSPDFETFIYTLKLNKKYGFNSLDPIIQTTYGLFEDNQLIGGFNIRHRLNKLTINHGGHIGYLIRPSKRNQGYGTKLLTIALEEAKKLNINKVLITCEVDNKASEQVILNNNGVYENDYYEQLEDKTYKRYWITLK